MTAEGLTTMTVTDTNPKVDTARVGYISGLRQLAEILEQHPDLPLPYNGSASAELLWIASTGEDHKAIAQTFARAIPGTIRKAVRDTAFDLIGRIDGLYVQLIVDRAEVCTRVVTGVETVTVPAQEATEARPARTEDREIVEWVCSPLLSDSVSA